MKKAIIIGFGILIVLVLAGSASAYISYSNPWAECSYCHTKGELSIKGNYYNETHKFDGIEVPATSSSCAECHTDLTIFLPLTSTGLSYNASHRYNDTTLASTGLAPPACENCHADVEGGNFNLLTGTPSYLASETCKICHKAKYDTWSNTLHRVMLTPRVDAEAMDLPLPVGATWDDIGFVRITKWELDYVNTTGYFLAVNDTYHTETEEWGTGRHAGGEYCGANCHTTGWVDGAENTEFPGMPGTFAEAGIGCERCHGAAGNGHQVTVNYSATLCTDCHSGSHHGTGWEDGAHAPPAARNGSSCLQCHSPFDGYQGNSINKTNATNVACGVCHNIHDITDDKYADTLSNGNFVPAVWSEVADSKLSFFNLSASLAAGTDVFDDLTNRLLYPGIDSSRKDASYGTEPINLTDRPVSDVLCSSCHYRHGLAHMAGVNASHGQHYYGVAAGAACIDCHMGGADAEVGKDTMKLHNLESPVGWSDTSVVDASKSSCGGESRCHTTSAQNLSKSSHSVVPVINEWNASAHNVKYVGVGGGYNHFYGEINESTGGSDKSRAPSCNKCHDPINWNPDHDSDPNEPLDTDFKGVGCTVCHNLHDMGNWLTMTEEAFGEAKGYARYNTTKVTTSHGYKAGYDMVENTTELCGNCHASVRIGSTEPGWGGSPNSRNDNTGFTTPHGYPAKDIFVGSWKETGLLKFECIDCHMASKVKDSEENVLPDSEKVKGHSFKVNATLLQASDCSSCHVTGNAILGNMSTTVEDIQADTHDKWNTTKATVLGAFETVNASTEEKNLSMDKLAQAYFNLKLVESDESWGVHNPTKIDGLLDDAIRLANEANASLGLKAEVVSTVQLKAGWNLVALNGTPAVTSTASVMSSVKNNITIVWGYNTSSASWELYDPDPDVDSRVNSLLNIVPGKGYWIRAEVDIEWTA